MFKSSVGCSSSAPTRFGRAILVLLTLTVMVVGVSVTAWAQKTVVTIWTPHNLNDILAGLFSSRE